ncbi:MAG TPA: phosphate ABC transporter permease subunit PstC [Actinomycetota bacterium]|nr:phosphate ABC transporter permease subunit PstC [Actinomycetota bacterium]
MATMTGDHGLTIRGLRGSPRRRRKEGVIRGILIAAAGISLVVSVGIVVALIGKAITFLTSVDLGQLWTEGWRPRSGQFDVPTIFIGTIEVSLIAMVIATPLGLGAAMYLSEYANPKTRRRLKPILETLAGIPSVVLGYFALTVINPYVVQDLFRVTSTFTITAAGIGVGILTIPLVASVAEDAMYAVPNALREGAYGIGARRHTVTTKVVFPAAVSGIVAALILGFSRALGETMVVAIAAGATGSATRHLNPFEPGQTMTGAISSLAIGSDSVKSASSGGVNPFDSLFFVGLFLFLLTFILNTISERFVRRVRRDY